MREAKVILVGAGSLGSYICLLLASMGFEHIVCYDDDLVEYHNHRNQLFREEDVGKPKVKALSGLIEFLTGVEIVPKEARAGSDTPFSGIVIVAPDSMEARKKIFEAVKYNARVMLFIDARSGGHVAMVYALNPLDPDGIQRYEETLYTDKESQDIPCANQTTLPTVWCVAAAVGKVLQLWREGWMPVCAEVLINYKELPGVSSEQLSI